MRRIHKGVTSVAWAMAVLGGLVLLALIVMTCLSVSGRAIGTALYSDIMVALMPGFTARARDLGIGAIQGDFELVEAGMAFCIFAFLPYCQVTSGHAAVDIVANALPMPANRTLVFIGELLFAVALVVIAVQLEAGFERKLRSGQTTQLLQMPIWWAYGASLIGAVLAALTAIYMAVLRLAELALGRDVVPLHSEANV
ncbi:TRAP transporter small permease [Pelagimonas varians]|uniref:TRAP transporter small permease protein n=1 Tax=Pelagimonas varians TaxID=696760 RepID=A0A238L1S3_9RHOB|nr:TRAP transporter small permease [Pelagimonas varians]PYG26667.1 tripartite ATP-independent transporter DctQ subunit [Pelagimonas varians]SMX49034.1 Tripartite ATP-independent periplasmic transporters, DctQ component [Pelagimonas varians]